MAAVPQRPPAAVVPPLHPHRVQVWRVFLDLDAVQIAGAVGLLSADERARADRFHFPHLRTRSIAARSALRRILGAQAGTDPAALVFAYTQQGKPYLPGSPLRFNVAHAHQLGLIAVAWQREIGVDIEFQRPMPDAEALARRFFAPAEVTEYLACRPNDRDQAFYNGWTRKEAYIKATGEGLRCPLDSFQVSLTPGAPARLVAVNGNPEEAGRWTMASLDAGPEYAAAVIAEGQDWRLETCVFEFMDGGGDE